MTEPPRDPVVIALFSEIVMVETLARTRLTRVLPRGMELSHFMVLNHFARLGGEKTPAQLARVFHVTKGAMRTPSAGSTPPAMSTSAPTGRTAAASGSRSAPPGSPPATAPSTRSRRSSTTWSARPRHRADAQARCRSLRALRELLDPD